MVHSPFTEADLEVSNAATRDAMDDGRNPGTVYTLAGAKIRVTDIMDMPGDDLYEQSAAQIRASMSEIPSDEHLTNADWGRLDLK